MNADPLELLVDAYRAETAHRARDAGALRTRVLTTARKRRRGGHRMVWLAAAAVLFAGSAALAASGSEKVTRVLDWIRSEVTEANAPKVREVRRVRGQPTERPLEAHVLATQAVDAGGTPRIIVPLSELPVDEPPAEANGHSTVRGSAADAPSPSAGPDLGAELSLYQRAHALHFGGGSPAEALEAWRLYLQTHPGGALAAEARLNEAVCLVKLGNRGAGRRLLESLSSGNAPQASRQQARELLLVLGPDEP